jgi:hypothetical protein
MAYAENTVEIKAPVSRVFKFVVDGMNGPKWRPGVIDVALAQGQMGETGATYKQGLKGPGGRRIDGDYRIIDLIPNQTFSFEVIAGPARPHGQYIFELGEAGTKLRFVLSLETRGLQKLLDPMITSTMKSEVACLQNLKTYLESHPD